MYDHSCESIHTHFLLHTHTHIVVTLLWWCLLQLDPVRRRMKSWTWCLIQTSTATMIQRLLNIMSWLPEFYCCLWFCDFQLLGASHNPNQFILFFFAIDLFCVEDTITGGDPGRQVDPGAKDQLAITYWFLILWKWVVVTSDLGLLKWLVITSDLRLSNGWYHIRSWVVKMAS